VLSPDGHSVAFIQRDSLFVLDLAGGEPRYLPTGTWRAWLPRWTRDGSVIRFLAPRARGERPAVFMVPRLGGPAQPYDGDPEEVLFTEQLTVPSVVSPLGERLAAQVWPDTLSRDTIQLPAPYYNAFFPAAISPNRKWIAIAGAFQDWASLVLWSREAHRGTVLASEGALPRWSIESDRVDFKARDGIRSIVFDTLSGIPKGPSEVLLADPDTRDFSIADDRSRIAYTRSSQRERLYIVDRPRDGVGATPKLLPITAGPGVAFHLALAPSGRRVAYIRSASGSDALFIQDLPDGPPRRLTYGTAANLRLVSWSPH
jgi:hypothetical protein